jgi:hypothetical protein
LLFSIAHSHIHAWLLWLLAPLLAADSAGVVSEGSNTIVAVWDTQAPQPTIQAVGTSYSSTDESKVTLYLSFGERVLQLNPLRLFTVTGLSRCGGRGAGVDTSRRGLVGGLLESQQAKCLTMLLAYLFKKENCLSRDYRSPVLPLTDGLC